MKIDKIIKSLEACVPQDERCEKCAYAKYDTFECIQKMHEDAITTLKELQQKKRGGLTNAMNERQFKGGEVE